MANFAKSRVPRFTTEVHHNPCLPEGGQALHAVVTVTATGGGSTGGRPVPRPEAVASGAAGPEHGPADALGPDAGVVLRVRTPLGAEVGFLRQVAPAPEDLTGRRRASGPRSGDYPTGPWGDESRDYHLFLRVPDPGLGREMLAARLSVLLPAPDGAAPRVVAQGLVRAVWTDDPAAAVRIDPQVAHHTGRSELAQVIQRGLDAAKWGDAARAVRELRRAARLAGGPGSEDTAKLLAKVVGDVDTATGTVRQAAKAPEVERESSRTAPDTHSSPTETAMNEHDHH
ncbi:hypothetical protein [Streptomyces yunnanensis]|uniref:von Willebrand factor type A C-terminal domain-containing protein n=1 Tax=Streptomyces yunnanensis TaxID=156453 RepID=A0A9X8MJ39_9ACTN|nr:hypothetical protein [Streptomyces yunnanensis]SHK79048.1 hypothetical protein SAMN05216268_101326 [Streptomyces yunnanensis]